MGGIVSYQELIESEASNKNKAHLLTIQMDENNKELVQMKEELASIDKERLSIETKYKDLLNEKNVQISNLQKTIKEKNDLIDKLQNNSNV